MTTFIRIVYTSIALALMFLLPQGCTDDPFYKYEIIPDGNGIATLNFTFTPDVDVNLSTRTSGDAIRNINDIFIVVYTIGGEKVCTKYYTKDDSNVNIEDVDRTQNSPVTTTEPTTKKATITGVELPYGRYHIYAVANMGDLATNKYSEYIQREDDFRKIRFGWNSSDVPSNNQMSGYFTNNDNYPTYDAVNYSNSACEVTFSPGQTYLHAWLRRAASKVTIDYDATNLNENIYIYLKKVTIKDIPKSCSLIDTNKPTGEEDGLLTDGESIQYSDTQEEDAEGDFTYVLSKGHPKLELTETPHADDANALFFYENMQGAGDDMPDKRQDADGDGFLDDAGEKKPGDPGWKDGVNGGTYIEVEAYYISSSDNNHGRGPIKYRFMMGKDVIKDYNAERNHHYKLTLKFNGNANDVDWHIEYDEEDRPGIYTPIYYVSYRYNEPDQELIKGDAYLDKCYPIRLAGDEIGEKVVVRIVENNWGTRQGTTKGLSPGEYGVNSGESVYTFQKSYQTSHKPRLSADVLHTGVWHGFLSLYKQEDKASIGTDANEVWQRFGAGEYIYWYSRGENPGYKNVSYNSTPAPINYPTSNYDSNCEDPTKNDEINYGEGYRIYDTSPGIHSSKEYGDYKVEVSYRNGIKETTLYIPLYTRPLIINQKKGFTGNNPFFSFQRYAKLRIDAKINGDDVTHFADVYQVRRIINPKGVFRAYGNDTPFTVSLADRNSESDEVSFAPFRSIGPWRASIIGDGWSIEGSSRGGSGSFITVKVKPDGIKSNMDVANAMLLIEYHDYKCVHYVHLRQGYAPQKIVDNGVYWHTFNTSYIKNADDANTAVAHMSHGPLDPGAMYRYGKFEYPIDLINNTRNMRDKIYPIPGKGFFIGPVDNNHQVFKAWNEIQADSKWPYTSMKSYDNVDVRLPYYRDFERLRRGSGNTDVDYAYGICYGDGATTIDTDARTAFYYSRYNHHGLPEWISELKYNTDGSVKYSDLAPNAGSDPYGTNGMRGCFVYNRHTQHVVFFPIGASSYGRRKSSGGLGGNLYGDGALHYADFDGRWTSFSAAQAHFVPAIVNLYSNYGACYWVADQITGINTESPNNAVVAWDFNYSTIDFAPIYDDNLHTKNNNGDACFLRLVQDTPPTQEQCDAMTERVDIYRSNDTDFWNKYE